MTLTLVFSEPRNVTNPGMDGVEYSFPFAMINSDFIGTPEQRSQTQERRFLISISRSRLASWRISASDLPKVLFEFGRRHIARLIEAREFPEEYTIHCPMISTASNPDLSCPFDPTLISDPLGYQMQIEESKPPIGFNSKLAR